MDEGNYGSIRIGKERLETYLVLDEKIAEEFHACAFFLEEYPCDYGKMRQLRIRLQDLCGVTELEALNILTNHNVDDYICKYSKGVHKPWLECKENAEKAVF